jgi:hypothetical protein
MPDSGPYLLECSTRRELANAIRYEIEKADFPANTFNQVKIRRLWSFIQRHGSSVAHFSVDHGSYEIGFHGLTSAEADEMRNED